MLQKPSRIREVTILIAVYLSMLCLPASAAPPSPPTSVVATAGDSTATVSFSSPVSNGGSAIIGYTVTSLPQGLTSTAASSPITVPGLTNGTSYTFSVTAINANNEISYSSATSSSVIPKATQFITFSNPGAKSFGTSPTITASSSSGLTPIFSSYTTGVCTITPGGTLTFYNAGTCTIAANQAGSGSYLAATEVSQSFAVNAVVPNAPTILTATAGDTQASIAFTAPANNGGMPITTYTVSSNPGAITASGLSSPLTITGLTNGTAYTFRMTATNNAGSSSYSINSNSITPFAPILIPIAGGVSATVTTNSSSNTIYLNLSGGAATSVSVFTSPSHGSVSATSTTIIYTPTPGYSGVDSFSYNASNSSGTSAPATVLITVLPPLITISPPALANPTTGASYSSNLNAGGGTAPHLFALTAGGLPAGLSLSNTGVISGTPTSSGLFNFTITATDNNSFIGSRDYILSVKAPILIINPASSALTTTVGSTFSQQISTSGGTAPYSYALATGALPAGITLNSNGDLAGQPTVAGTYSFTITATDSSTGSGAPFSASQSYTLDVSAAPLPPTPTLNILPASGTLTATAGSPFNQQISSSGGTAPYSYAVTLGKLPKGITLNSIGTLTGTPTDASSSTFTITATDSGAYSVSSVYTLNVSAVPIPTPTLSILPASGTLATTAGSTFNQQFSTSGGTAPYSYAVTLGKLPNGIALKNNGNLTGVPTDASSSTFTITATDSSAYSVSSVYTLNVSAVPIPTPTLSILPASGTLATTAGSTFNQQFSTSGGTAPYNYAVTTGALPAGIKLSSDGLLAGTPTVTGTFNIGITSTDANTVAASNTYAIQVNGASPVAPSQALSITAEHALDVDLTSSASGGPFSAANVISVIPINAGSATISAVGNGYKLHFLPTAGVSGSVVVSYTLTNNFATSAPGAIHISVIARSDPSKDAEVQGIINAQANASRRFSSGQISNFQQRLEALHGGNVDSFSNGFNLTSNSLRRQSGKNNIDVMQQWLQVQNANGKDRDMLNTQAAEEQAPLLGNQTGAASYSPLAIWTAGTISIGNDAKGSSSEDQDFVTSGLSAGADYRLSSKLTVGLGFGYGYDKTEIGDNGSRTKSDSYSVAVYSSYRPVQEVYLDAVLGYQRLSFDTRRYIIDSSDKAKGDRNGNQIFVSLATGYEYRKALWLLNPYLRLDFTDASLDSYEESGNSQHALSYDQQTVKTSSSSLGIRSEYGLTTAIGELTPSMRLEYQHDFQGASNASMRFADVAGGLQYRTSVEALGQDRGLLGFGLGLRTNADWRVRMEYQVTVSSGNQQAQSLLFNLEKPF